MNDFCPASTVAISSSLVAKMVAPNARSRASFGETRVSGRTHAVTIATATTIASTVVSRRDQAISTEVSAMPAPVATLTSASRAAARGEPSSGISRNGTRKLPAIEPIVLTARKVPALRPVCASSSSSSADAAGNDSPSTIVVSSTTGSATPMSTPSDGDRRSLGSMA